MVVYLFDLFRPRVNLTAQRKEQVVGRYIGIIEMTALSQRPWDESTIQNVENTRTSRDELAILRRALTGEKASPVVVTSLLVWSLTS